MPVSKSDVEIDELHKEAVAKLKTTFNSLYVDISCPDVIKANEDRIVQFALKIMVSVVVDDFDEWMNNFLPHSIPAPVLKTISAWRNDEALQHDNARLQREALKLSIQTHTPTVQ